MSRAEHRLADAAQRREAVLTGNGVTALWSVLTALGLPAGARVLLPDLACERGPGAVALAGLDPIFADVRPETATPSPAALAVAAAAQGARAVIPTHLFGRHGRLPTPDPDCPQIVDATQCGIAPRSLAGGAAAVVSFGPGRQLDLGGGGAVLTDDPDLAAEVRAVVAGLGDGGDGILRAVPSWLDTRLTIALARHRDARRRRRARGRLLREALAALPGLYPLDLPEPDVPWRVTVRIPGRRDAVKRALERAGFAPTALFAPLHRLTGRSDREYPCATLLAAQLLNLDPARLGDDPVAAARHAAAAAATVLDPPRRNEATHA
jgi:dTDP-4-amino-4,6-dideoxygalactose transaminase